MAANSSSRAVSSFGKRFVSQFFTNSPATRPLSATSVFSRRSLHGSVYDKNVEDHVCPVVVPDDMISPQSDKYWAPNPNTGVFGPAAYHNAAAGVDIGFQTSPSDAGSESVLEQKTFFRPFEDLDKPQHP